MQKHNIEERSRAGKPVLIAEIGVNYYDIAKRDGTTPMQAAKEMILAAGRAGVHAVKFQSYKAGALAARNSPAYWDTSEEPTTSQYELFRSFDSFGEAEYRALSEFSAGQGIEFLSTPFDFASADYLCDMMNVYKISSSDLTNLPFIAHVAAKGKPVLLSVGASNLDEIQRAVDTIRKHNSQPLVLLHCVLEYPTPLAHANLRKIASLKQQFPDVVPGYSDHTKPVPGHEVLSAAFALGAVVIEKHFTLDKTLKGNDHYHAMDEQDASEIVAMLNRLEQELGSGDLQCLDSEMSARKNARRSVVAKVDIPEGSVVAAEMFTFKRPGTGLSPSRLNEIVGKKSRVAIAEDTIVEEGMFG